MKLAGFLLIVLSCSAFGFLASNRLKTRTSSLEKAISALMFLENEVSYGKNDIKTALKNMTAMHSFPTFFDAFSDTCSIKESLLNCINEPKFSFSVSDKEIFKEFLDDLGSLDTVSQLKSIHHTKSLIKLAKEDSDKNYLRFGKLYKSMGVLCGFLFSIILL